MGLAVEVGIFADVLENDPDAADQFRESFERVNAALADAGLPQHHEPETPPMMRSRCSCGSYPYTFLHHLRCVYAHFEGDPNWRPRAGERMDPDDPILERSYARTRSHLIQHSDCEGYYVPFDFDDIVRDERVPGGMLGSSYRLRDELVAVAPVLGIRLQDGELSDEEAARVDAVGESDSAMSKENLVWLSLFEAARLSIEHRAAICFT
jgi:hypothetical protein